MHDRLPRRPARLRVVPDPLVGPRDRLPPPVRVRMIHTKVDIGQREGSIEITAVRPVIRRIVRIPVERSLATPRHQVVRVQALDERAHLVDPDRQRLRRAVAAHGKVADAVGAAAGLVRELPRHDRRRVAVPRDERLDVLLESIFDLREAVELQVESCERQNRIWFRWVY